MQDAQIRRVRHKQNLARKKNVAAYARVSTGKDAMLHSLSAQISYYSALIQNTRGWLYAGVYADEAMTGTKSERPNFMRMLDDARAGKIDLIITKSISRFARNTLTLLETIRELKILNVDVFFEEQNIHSISSDGELMLAFLASYAQEESKSASENLKWSIRNGFKKGIAWNTYVYGYEFVKGSFFINVDEAKVVKEIFNYYLDGRGILAIAKILNERELKTKLSRQWRHGSVAYVLRNYLYTGNMLLQSTYKDSFITKRKVVNDGILPKYHVENTHEAIIDMDTYKRVQEMIVAKQNSRKKQQYSPDPTLYKGLLICEHCGQHYRRRITKNKAYWICSTYNMFGKKYCPSKQIPEDVLNEAISHALSTETMSRSTLEKQLLNVLVCDGQSLRVNLKDGTEIEAIWKHKSRSKSWTPEMKELARHKAMKGNVKNEENNSNTINN